MLTIEIASQGVSATHPVFVPLLVSKLLATVIAVELRCVKALHHEPIHCLA